MLSRLSFMEFAIFGVVALRIAPAVLLAMGRQFSRFHSSGVLGGDWAGLNFKMVTLLHLPARAMLGRSSPRIVGSTDVAGFAALILDRVGDLLAISDLPFGRGTSSGGTTPTGANPRTPRPAS